MTQEPNYTRRRMIALSIIVIILVLFFMSKNGLIKGPFSKASAQKVTQTEQAQTMDSKYAELEEKYNALSAKYDALEASLTAESSTVAATTIEELPPEYTIYDEVDSSESSGIEVIPESIGEVNSIYVLDANNERVSLDTFESLDEAMSYPINVYTNYAYEVQMTVKLDGESKLTEAKYIYDIDGIKEVDTEDISEIDGNYLFRVRVGNDKLTTVILKINGKNLYTTIYSQSDES